MQPKIGQVWKAPRAHNASFYVLKQMLDDGKSFLVTDLPSGQKSVITSDELQQCEFISEGFSIRDIASFITDFNYLKMLDE